MKYRIEADLSLGATVHILVANLTRGLAGLVAVATALTGVAVPATGLAVPATGLASAAPRAITSSDYALEPVRVGGLSVPVEMVGHVVRPTIPDPSAPLVLFLHGMHQPCYEAAHPTGRGDGPWPCPRGTSPVPSHLGYRYLQRLLAGQGYVTVSIAANGVNAQGHGRDLGAAARGQLVRRHLEQWAGWDADGTYSVDLDNVVVVGHSRGGEGVNRAALSTPLTAPYRITGEILIAPTSVLRQTAAYVPTVVMLPYCDGDVSGSEGQRYVDLGRDLTADDTSLRSAVMVMGANHNYFNTEWTPGLSVAGSGDDWGDGPGRCGSASDQRLTPAEQRAVAKAYVAGAVGLLARHDQSMLPLFDGSEVTLPSVGDAVVLSHAIGGDRVLRRPGLDAMVAPGATARAVICRGYADPGITTAFSASAPRPACGRDIPSVRTPHWAPSTLRGVPAPPALELAWTRPGQYGGLTFAEPLDLASATSLDLRTIVDAGQGDVRLRIRLRDGTGHSAWLRPVGGSVLRPLHRGGWSLPKRWARTVRVSPASVSGVDLTAVTGVDVQGVSQDGRVWLLDVAAASASLPPVPAKRLATLDLGDVRVTEGDGPGSRLMHVPYRVFGRLSAPARVVLTSFDTETSRWGRPTYADLPAGTTAGTIALPYTPDDLDDRRVQVRELTVYPVFGIMTRDATASARIMDDDPSPRVRVERVKMSVREGTSARWRVTLSAPVDFAVDVSARVVRGRKPLPRVRVSDVGVAFRKDYIDPSMPVDTPLHKMEVFVGRTIAPGRRSVTVSVPLRRDGASEPREAITMRVRIHGVRISPVERTIVVRDR